MFLYIIFLYILYIDTHFKKKYKWLIFLSNMSNKNPQTRMNKGFAGVTKVLLSVYIYSNTKKVPEIRINKGFGGVTKDFNISENFFLRWAKIWVKVEEKQHFLC